MDINDNQQINTFLKGMNTDVSDALIDSSQYRYAENLRLVTNTDSNEGELRIVDSTSGAYSVPGEILSLTQVRDLLIAITKTTYDEMGPVDGISVYTNKNKGTGDWFCVVDNLPYLDFCWGDGKPHFSLVCRWESDSNIKLYIASGVYPIISINVTKQYNHPGKSHNTIEDIAGYAVSQLSPISLQISSGGTIKSAKVQYVYRFYNIGEPASQLSPFSYVLSLYKGYNEGYETEKNTNRAVNIFIPAQQNAFSKIQVFRINYVILGQEPTVNMIYDGEYNKSGVTTIRDIGQSIEQYGTAEFLALQDPLVIPKIIESKEDYLFAANLKYTKDDYDKQLTELNFRSYSTGDFENGWSSDYESARQYNKQYDTQTGYDFDNWKRPYTSFDDEASYGGGIGPIVSWFYTAEQYYVDKDNTFYTSRMVKTALPVVSLRRGEVYRYGIILYNTKGIKSSVYWVADIMIPDKGFDEYDGGSGFINIARLPKYSSENKWEVSVIGIRFQVDTSRIPDCGGFEIVRCERTINDSYTISQGILGITTTVKQITFNGGADNHTYSDTGFTMPQGIISAQYLLRNESNQTVEPNRRILIFASPEHSYQPDDIEDIAKANSTSLYVDTVASYYMPTTIDYRTFIYSTTNDYRIEFTNFVRFQNNQQQNINNDHSLVLQYSTSGNSVKGIDEMGGIFASCLHGENDTITPFFLDSIGQNKQWETGITQIAALYNASSDRQRLDIKEVEFPDVPKPNSFFTTDKIGTYRDAVTPIGNVQHISWAAQRIFSSCTSDMDADVYDELTRYETIDDFPEQDLMPPAMYVFACGYISPIGIQGRSILLETNNDFQDQFDGDVYAPITVANIKKSATPYNGPLSYKNATVDYISFGDYMATDSTGVETLDVYDGDCYPGIFQYTSLHTYDNTLFKWANRSCINYYVPVESTVDLRATYGSLYSRLPSNSAHDVQPLAGSVKNHVQPTDEYLYNTAYNAAANIKTYSQTVYEYIDTNNFDVRVHNSQRKTNNERVDNWATFKATDYIDVDSRFGEITNLRLFKDKLLYWQKDAVGILSVNERTVLNDLENHNIIIGTGGILDRFDYISTVYGMKHNQYEAETQSSDCLYWWDEYRKEILQYAGGQQVAPLTTIKNLRNYINNNTPNTHPSITYNNKYKEIICSVENNESLVFNEKAQCFTSIYKMMPLYRAIIDNTVIISNKTNLYHMDSGGSRVSLLGNSVYPKIDYVVNRQNIYNKVFDITTFGGRFYGGDDLSNLTFEFNTPLKQHSTGTGNSLITNREYDFRLDVPRNNGDAFGGRMRGKTMQCELRSSSNSSDFSLQYIVTKYRMSWS